MPVYQVPRSPTVYNYKSNRILFEYFQNYMWAYYEMQYPYDTYHYEMSHKSKSIMLTRLVDNMLHTRINIYPEKEYEVIQVWGFGDQQQVEHSRTPI